MRYEMKTARGEAGYARAAVFFCSNIAQPRLKEEEKTLFFGSVGRGCVCVCVQLGEGDEGLRVFLGRRCSNPIFERGGFFGGGHSVGLGDAHLASDARCSTH